jgi:hypothetical protein
MTGNNKRIPKKLEAQLLKALRDEEAKGEK